MIVGRNTTMKEILAVRPDAIEVFEKHGVDVALECDKSLYECALDKSDDICHIDMEDMCHIDNINGLIQDLQKFLETMPQTTNS